MSNKKLIVGIDDSQLNRFIFEEVAKILEVDIITASDGDEGVEKIFKSCNDDRPPTLIITDINMPNVSGIEVIKTLKENNDSKYIPILVLTTESDYDLQIKGKELGAAGWLQKPLDADEVALIIKKFLKM